MKQFFLRGEQISVARLAVTVNIAVAAVAAYLLV
jgi:hypothetical protein